MDTGMDVSNTHTWKNVTGGLAGWGTDKSGNPIDDRDDTYRQPRQGMARPLVRKRFVSFRGCIQPKFLPCSHGVFNCLGTLVSCHHPACLKALEAMLATLCPAAFIEIV